ncbi:glycosyltransferase family 2 protein [Ilyobacter sp.]|uniref:glycosyltransferase family 2 protein n=1 Tax=Ilyobacter sp. TaxID=3100343 RepID=UPI003564C2F6
MQNEKLISVIIPFYNIGEFVKKTINSLDSQTYRNFEVIFVNDASTDNSLQIIEESLKKVTFDHKIINREKNGGPSPSRNIGLKEARGEYIYFLDSDDFLYKNAFEESINLFEREDPDIVFFKFKKVDENGKTVQNYNDIFKDVKKIEKNRDILIKYINLEIFLYTCSVIYKKKVLNNIFYNENNETHYYVEDQDFCIRALLNSNKIGYINSELVQYFKRKGSIMNGKFNIRRLNKIRLFDTLYNEYKTKDQELSNVFLKRRSKEILWVIRSYIKNETDQNSNQMKKYIKENILTTEITSYLEWKYSKKLNIKNIIQIFLLRYFPGCFINLAKLL